MKNIISNINKTFENRVRLGIMSILMVNHSVNFNRMKELLDITDGNLSSNISVLEKFNYIDVQKDIVNKKTKTTFQITPSGKSSFKEHISALENLIHQEKKGGK